MAKAKKILTTGFGMPVNNDLNSMTAGAKGPVPMQDVDQMGKEALYSHHHGE